MPGGGAQTAAETASLSSATLFVASQANSSRPKWPWQAVRRKIGRLRFSARMMPAGVRSKTASIALAIDSSSAVAVPKVSTDTFSG